LAISNPYQQYKKTQIDTANQGKLIVMLYDGAIKFINLALDAIPSRSIEKIHNNIIRAQDIINELITSLNMEVGEISEKLFSVYMYIKKRLIEANIKKQPEPLIEVRNYLMELREAWEQAAKNAPIEKKDDEGGVNIAT